MKECKETPSGQPAAGQPLKTWANFNTGIQNKK